MSPFNRTTPIFNRTTAVSKVTATIEAVNLKRALRCATVLLALTAGASLGLEQRAAMAAQAPQPAPSATPSYAMREIVEPLREIGRVKARSAFCTTLLKSAAPATRSALTFEARMLDTLDDLHAVSFSDELAKARTLRKVERDLNELADLALLGRAELDGVRDLAANSDTDLHGALLGFVDALDGAKAHQLTLARQLSNVYGQLAEHPAYSTVNTPADQNAGLAAFGRSAPLHADADWLATDESQEHTARASALFAVNDDDRKIGDDLRHAGAHGRIMLTLGGCGIAAP